MKKYISYIHDLGLTTDNICHVFLRFFYFKKWNIINSAKISSPLSTVIPWHFLPLRSNHYPSGAFVHKCTICIYTLYICVCVCMCVYNTYIHIHEIHNIILKVLKFYIMVAHSRYMFILPFSFRFCLCDLSMFISIDRDIEFILIILSYGFFKTIFSCFLAF